MIEVSNVVRYQTLCLKYFLIGFMLVVCACVSRKNDEEFRAELKSANLLRGDIALCMPENSQLGKVQIGLSCAEQVRDDFNTALALLHSFEYIEAEKIFSKVIDGDPECIMAYWGVAMSNFHPLWFPPTREELIKGERVISIAKSFPAKSRKEEEYLEAIGVMYEDWDEISHRDRISKFEQATRAIYEKYPDDTEAAVFYALALRAAADPSDKTFSKQIKAGEILEQLFASNADHPGIAHYLIHIYDYPELAKKALPAARRYASIASASAHAQHMPSHIFTRLGLWDEAISSNLNSIAAAKCYAENSGMKGHWDEELHGIDYLVYAYLQQGKYDFAKKQKEYLQSIEAVSPSNNKCAYTFAAVPTRVAVEQKKWKEAAELKLLPENFEWKNYPWERSIVSFGRALGGIKTGNKKVAQDALTNLQRNYDQLQANGKTYEAEQVKIQVLAVDGWIKLMEGDKSNAIRLMEESALMEDKTEKHPVTPGELVPARELLGEMYFALELYDKALVQFESNLEKHPGRLNGLQGAANAARKLDDQNKLKKYLSEIHRITQGAQDLALK